MLKDFGKEKFDIIILSGQSNSEGCGLGYSSNPFVPPDNVYYLDNNFIISQAKESVCANSPLGNLSLSFCTKYIESGRLNYGHKLLVVRAAVGGTGFLDKRWGINDDLFQKMIELTKTALELNPDNRLVAFLWHQGETDASLKASENEHYNNLQSMIITFRINFNCTDLPFIAGNFVHQWIDEFPDICLPVINAIKKVCADVGYARFVDTDGLQSNAEAIINDTETVHFCREALNQLGLRYFNAFCEITK